MSKPVIHCRVQFNGGTDFTKRFGIEPGGRVQKVIDMNALDRARLYEPRREGIMHSAAESATNYGSGEVNYPGPYARYQYVGLVRTDEHGRTWVGKGESKPVLTDRPLRYNTQKKGKDGKASELGNPNAQSHWWEKMKENHTQEILQLASKEANRGR